MNQQCTEKDFLSALHVFADTLNQNYASHIAANPEDQLKRPVCSLIESMYDRNIQTVTEAQVEGLGARPDIGVARQQLLCGHIELKAPGKGANTNRLAGADKKQWNKFKALPNLMYTDGLEWALYRNGERIDSPARFSGDIIEDGANAVTEENAARLYSLLLNFLNWQPIVPEYPKALANMLAPLCRLLREDVETAASLDNSNISILYRDWQRLFFPDADPHQFADAYAQTLTYSMLLARLLGAGEINPLEAAKKLDSGHGLLAQTLRHLGDDDARREIDTAVSLLERVIQAIDTGRLARHGDTWLYFYEDFLAAYDPKLRKDSGVYYTPVEVIGCQIRLCAQLLEEKFGKSLNYADEGVTFLDPAAGTAAYPLAAIKHGLDTASKYGPGIISGKATEMARNFNAFEYMVGPYAVAHLRITQVLQEAGATFPDAGIRVFLTDTLDDPDADPPRFGFAERQIAQEHQRAQAVKRDSRILVCMGNPPYDREQRDENDDTDTRRKGGWVRFGSDRNNHTDTVGILRDFIDGAPGIHVKNLYNDYVYFWRWALWKLYENRRANGPGILSFITASSYLRGPGFVSMRRRIREAFDDLWIIDLEGDNLGARKTENVFNIQTPVAIAIGVRYGDARSDIPATARYTKITGSRDEKLSRLHDIKRFDDIEWSPCYNDWESALLPEGQGDFFSWPLVIDVFPWQHSGVQYKRKWPIAETRDLLEQKWDALIRTHDNSDRAMFMRETGSRNLHNPGNDLITNEQLGNLEIPEPSRSSIIRYGYRSFDRQWCLADDRLCDRPRPPLWTSYSEHQIFLTSLLTEIFGEGPAASITNNIPDLHHFRGSFGGKHVIPLWRNAEATEPNVTQGILSLLRATYDAEVSPDDLFAYAYAVLATPRYTERFSEELSQPGPRLPVTKDYRLFRQASDIGKTLIHLHTYGERFIPDGSHPGQIPQGTAKCVKGIPSAPEAYPESFEYTETRKLLRVGDGEFGPVEPEIWRFSVSGLQVVKSWLDYRKKTGAGRHSSPLDDIRPTEWTATMTQELLELLWVLEHTLKLYPGLEELLEKVVQSDCFTADDLPQPSDAEREPPQRRMHIDLFDD